jgi:hypothetical protein
MLLTVVLIVFTLVLSVMSIGLFIWWKKYGKDMFSMIKTMNNIPKNKEFPFDIDILRKNPNFPDDLTKNLKKLQDLMGKPLKKQ